MTHDTEEGNRLLSGEAEGRFPQDQANVEAHREPANAIRSDRKDGCGAMRLTRRSVFKRLAGVVGGLVLGRMGHAHAAVAEVPPYPVPADPTKVLGRGISP